MDPSPPIAHTHLERPVISETRGLRQMGDFAPSPLHTRRTSVQRLRAPQRSKIADDLYRTMVAEFKARYKISIRKWHTHMAGIAYELKFRDGRIKRLIAAPRPRSPVSAAIFLHEVGHHAVGFHRYSPRCLEEHYAWQWAFREMNAREIPINESVLRHYRRSMHHYVRMTQRHGQIVPHDLRHFFHHSSDSVRA